MHARPGWRTESWVNLPSANLRTLKKTRRQKAAIRIIRSFFQDLSDPSDNQSAFLLRMLRPRSSSDRRLFTQFNSMRVFALLDNSRPALEGFPAMYRCCPRENWWNGERCYIGLLKSLGVILTQPTIANLSMARAFSTVASRSTFCPLTGRCRSRYTPRHFIWRVMPGR